MSQSKVRLVPHGLEKSTRPDHLAPTIELARYKYPELDPASHLGAYLQATQDLRQSESLFVTHARPHKGATGQTLARELRTMIEHDQSGSTGSMMSMSTSRAASRRVSMTDILLVIEILPEREVS